MKFSKHMMIASSILFATACTTVTSAEQKTVHLQMSADQTCNATIELKVGETLRFSADENPTTGYAWQLQQPLHYLTEESEYTSSNTGSKVIVGAGGTRDFYFTAVKKGQEEIKLAYLRSWEQQSPAQLWNCTIEVK